MLIKKELATIPVLPYPNVEEKKNYTYKDFAAAAAVKELTRSGKILVIDFFGEKHHDLLLRFFTDGNSFQCCKEWPAEEWLQHNPRTVLGECTSDDTEEDRKLAWEFLSPGRRSYYCGGLLGIVDSFAIAYRAERRERTVQNAEALMNEHFAMYPGLPKNLGQYCENHVFHKAYIFIDALDRKGKRKAMCSHCGKHFTLGRKARSGQETTCPKCGRSAVYRGSWVKHDIEEKEKICIAANVNNQLLLRWTDVIRITRPNKRPEFRFDDYAYNLYLNTPKGPKIYFYKWLIGPYCYGYDWYRGKNGDVCHDSAYIYTDNLTEVFGETYYKVDLQKELASRDIKIVFTSLLDSLKNAPVAEYLFKMHMPILASHANCIRANMDTAHPNFGSVLGVSNQLKPLYVEMDPEFSEHRVIKHYGGWISRDEFLAYRRLGIKDYAVDIAMGLLENMSFKKFVNYFTKQRKLHPEESIYSLLYGYRDYLDMSKSLKVDLSNKSVRYPGDIVLAHNLLVPRYNIIAAEIREKAAMEKAAKENKKFQEAVEQLYSELQCTEFERNGLCIVLPQSRTDLVVEGQSLHHCVGGEGYYLRHIEGYRMIFFIRKARERTKPYFTLEVLMNTFKIGQLYGFGDCSAPKEIRQFAEQFVRRLAGKKERRSA